MVLFCPPPFSAPLPLLSANYSDPLLATILSEQWAVPIFDGRCESATQPQRYLRQYTPNRHLGPQRSKAAPPRSTTRCRVIKDHSGVMQTSWGDPSQQPIVPGLTFVITHQPLLVLVPVVNMFQ